MGRIVSWITEYSYGRPLLIAALVAAVTIFGVWTFFRVNQELIPDVEFPLLTVVAQVPDGQPDEVASGVTRSLEAAASDLDGLDSIQSTSVAGLSVVLINFDFGTDLGKAERSFNEALGDGLLPPDTTTTILKFDPSILPIVEFSLQGDLSQAELLDLAQTSVLPQLSGVNGVGSVEVVGGALNEVVISLDRAEMLDRGLTFDEVSEAIQANNVIIPSGQVAEEGKSVPLETVSVLTSLDAIRQITIPAADGSLVQLDEIAAVEQGEAASVGVNRTNGQPSVGIRVAKEKAGNTVDVAHGVTGELDKIETTLPAGASITIFSDQSEFITESINGVLIEGAIGGVLAIIVIFIFLANWRTTLVTAVSIPLSLLAAIILLDQLGYSLNIMTLGGLTIAIGRVIDDSIVVLENVYRHMAQGERTFPAIINGAREVTIAIVGATATTCAVFLPLGFTGGIIGELFISFSLAVVFALIASLVVAVTVIPVLARLSLAGKVKVQPDKQPGSTLIGRVYTPALKLALANRVKTLTVAGALFVGSLFLLPLLPLAFFPASGENIITISVNARPGQTQDSILEQAISVEGLLDEFDVEEYTTVITGPSSDFGAIAQIVSGKDPNSATITVELARSEDKQDAAAALRSALATELSGFDNVSVSASGGGFGPESNLEYVVSADTSAAAGDLPAVAAEVLDAIAGLDGTANARSDIANAQDTVSVEVDAARAAAAGLSPSHIAASLKNLSAARPITSVNFDGEPLAVRLVASGGDVSTVDGLGALEIASGVRLDSVATLTEVTKQTSVTRVDGNPAATITADITDDDVGAVSTNAQSAVDKLDVPDGIDVSVGGIGSDINEGFTSMLIAIMIAIVLVYAVMALLFQSWVDPFVILFSLPLALIGTFVALVATGSPLSISALIGVLMLVGIVVTNAIVLLEFVIMLRKERGYSTYDALIEGGQTRLRPILMTAIAAMLALVPLSLGLTEGALIASDLGRVVIGGLFSSTLLTLLVVPVVYSLADDLKTRFSRRQQGPHAA